MLRSDRYLWRSVRKNWDLYLMLVPVLAYFIIFHYAPMYGVQIAFRRYSVAKGITGSTWVGWYHFDRFFRSYYCQRLITNTLVISLYNLALGFPLPILLAIMINETRSARFRKTVQTVTYAPHFLSTVVVVSILDVLFKPGNGLVNNMLRATGNESVYFMAEPDMFKHLYVLSGVWQSTGWNSIIYVAALAGIDQALYEAATVDGASRWQTVLHITLPGLLPTATIMLILSTGQMMNLGFEKAYLMQNDLNIAGSDIISTYVYRIGLISGEYSFSAAVGLFNSVINCVLLFSVNALARRMSDTSLW